MGCRACTYARPCCYHCTSCILRREASTGRVRHMPTYSAAQSSATAAAGSGAHSKHTVLDFCFEYRPVKNCSDSAERETREQNIPSILKSDTTAVRPARLPARCLGSLGTSTTRHVRISYLQASRATGTKGWGNRGRLRQAASPLSISPARLSFAFRRFQIDCFARCLRFSARLPPAAQRAMRCKPRASPWLRSASLILLLSSNKVPSRVIYLTHGYRMYVMPYIPGTYHITKYSGKYS